MAVTKAGNVDQMLTEPRLGRRWKALLVLGIELQRHGQSVRGVAQRLVERLALPDGLGHVAKGHDIAAVLLVRRQRRGIGEHRSVLSQLLGIDSQLLAHAVECAGLQFAKARKGHPAVAEVELHVIPASRRIIDLHKQASLASEASNAPDELFASQAQYRT